MSADDLKAELEAAIGEGKPFGPEDGENAAPEISGAILREALIRQKRARSSGLWLRNTRVTGKLDLAGCEVKPRLLFTGCHFEQQVELNQATLSDLSMLFCELDEGLHGPQLDVKWNLQLSGTELHGLILTSAKIGGRLSLGSTKLWPFPKAGEDAPLALSAKGIEVEGEIEGGGLIAEGCVLFSGARVSGPVRFVGAELSAAGTDERQKVLLNLDAADVGGLNCNKIEISGDVRMVGLRVASQMTIRQATIRGTVCMLGVRVGAELAFDDTVIESPAEAAIEGDRLRVGSGLYCGGKFRAEGDVAMPGARIGGQACFDGARIEGVFGLIGTTIDAELGMNGTMLINPGKVALNADRLRAQGGIYAREGFEAQGELRLLGARVGGQLSILQATLNNPGGTAFHADGIQVEGDFHFAKKSTITGDVELAGARLDSLLTMSETEMTGSLTLTGASIDVDLTFEHSKIRNGGETAVNAERIVVSGAIILTRFESDEIRLPGASAETVLIHNAKLDGSEGNPTALFAEAMSIKGDVMIRRVETRGTMKLASSVIGGRLSFVGGELRNENGRALDAEQIEVEHGVVFRGKLIARGGVVMSASRIGGQLSVGAVKFENEGDVALSLNRCEIDELVLVPLKLDGEVDLRQTQVKSLRDVENGKLSECEISRMDGFTYRSLQEPLNASSRLGWIERSQKGRYYPGVYVELADAFRRVGHTTEARKVAIARERRAREELGRLNPRRLLHDALYITIGYGYRNWLALFWLLGFIAVGAVAFCLGENHFSKLVEKAPDFNAILYSIDATVPVLDVGQQKAWAPTGLMAWVSLALAISGYALATAVIAAAAGLLSRDQR